MPASRLHSHYSLLKVDSTANAQQIKAAYSEYYSEYRNRMLDVDVNALLS